MKHEQMHTLYTKVAKPVLFSFDPELIHDLFTWFGETTSRFAFTRATIDSLFNYTNQTLAKEVNGIMYANPVGLAAGFDYNGRMAGILKHVGFGFNTVGTVTYSPYEGNPKPRMVRMPKSQAILVNKGFKSEGVHKVVQRLNNPLLKDVTFGVSVGSSNIPSVDTIEKAIEDYIKTFDVLRGCENIKYYELNISCPNTSLTENFTVKKNYEALFKEVTDLHLAKPVYIKMPNELVQEQIVEIVASAFTHGFNSFIFSNLIKDRANPYLDKDEVHAVSAYKGNFSGKPTSLGSSNHLRYFRSKYGKNIILVGCGGIFTPQDAFDKLNAGADLLQLVTGMIYEGPQLIGQINKHLSSSRP